MDPALEQKLREVIDRQEIWALMQRYGRAVDRCDRELLRSVYWPDATEDHGSFVGTPEQFIDWVMGIADRHVSAFHGLLNHSCDLVGDNAYCETYYLSVMISQKPPFMMSTGRYVDHFQRRNGEWRIANRVVSIEGRYDLQDSAAFSTLVNLPGYAEKPVATHDLNDVSYHRPPHPRKPQLGTA